METRVEEREKDDDDGGACFIGKVITYIIK
jgi:hypothetical protein